MFIFKVVLFLHVATAILWVGGGAVMTMLGLRALKNSESAEVVTIMKQLGYLARTIFMPASVVMLITGLYVVWEAGELLSLWAILGLLGLIATGALGGAVMTPMVKEFNAMDHSGGLSEEGRALATRMLAVAKVDMVLLFTVVFDMAYKPDWSNFIVWPLMLLVVAAGVFLFMPRDLLPSRPSLERTRDFGTPTGTKIDEDDDDK